MIYIIFATILMFFAQVQSSESSVLQIKNISLTVGTAYMGYKTYESYRNEDKKIGLIQEAVNNDTNDLMKKYDEKMMKYVNRSKNF